jgi:hypothetical protein
MIRTRFRQKLVNKPVLSPRILLRTASQGPKPRLSAICGLTVALVAFDAAAQTTEPLLPVPSPPSGPQAPVAPGQTVYAGQTVTQRPRPDLDPLGLHIGDFFWFPRAEVDAAYNSNIFATQTATTSDLITTLQPGFDLLSIFPRNALNVRGGAATEFYSFHPTQNTQDGFIAVDGRWDVTAASGFYAAARADHLHLPRTSPNSPGDAAEPVTYNAYTANAGYAQTGLRVGYRADIAVQNAQYNSVPRVGGGTLPQSSQDNTFSQAALRGDYELIPDYRGYIRVAGNLNEYQHTVPGGVRFNSSGYRADIGLQILPRHILYGEVYGGYLSQMYQIGGALSGLDAGGRLVYNPTGLTTATFTGVRTIVPSNPSIGSTGSGYLASTVTGSVDHELLRNLLLNAAISYENDTFLGISRVDNVFGVAASVKYLLNRNFYLGGTYNYQQRSSQLAGFSYTINILMLRLSTQF